MCFTNQCYYIQFISFWICYNAKQFITQPKLILQQITFTSGEEMASAREQNIHFIDENNVRPPANPIYDESMGQ